MGFPTRLENNGTVVDPVLDTWNIVGATVTTDETNMAVKFDHTTIPAGSAITAAAGATSFDYGSATGAFTLPTGNISWAGAANKTASLVAGGAFTITGGAASTWSTSAGALSVSGFGGINLQVNGATLADVGVTSASALTLAAGKNLTLTSGAVSLTGAVGGAAPLSVTGAIQTSGATGLLSVTGAASTAQTASTEINFVNFNLAQTVQWATGAITTERALRVQAPTLSFVGASTVTTAATVSIDGPPVAGTNATITNNPFALMVGSGDVLLAGSGAALLTTANTGFTWLPNTGGTPTGAPVGPTGATPIVIDTGASKIWVRIAGTWKGVAVA